MQTEIFCNQFLLFFISFLIITISGFVILNFLKVRLPKQNLYSVVFISNAVGLGFIVCAYATFWLGIHTIFFVGLIGYGLFYILNRKQEEKNHYSVLVSRHEWIVIITICIFILGFYGISFCDVDSPFNTYDLSGDYVYYARVSKYLTEAKQENYFHYFNLLLPEKYNGLMLYHYFDLWLNNFYSQFSSLSAYFLLRLVTEPYFQILILIGLVAIAKEYLQWQSEYYYLLICPVIVFWGNVDLFLSWFEPEVSTYYHDFFNFRLIKLSPVVFYLIGAALAFINKDNLLTLFMILFISLVYSVTLPAVLVTTGISLFFMGWFGELKWDSKEALFYKMFVVVLLVVIAWNTPPAIMSYGKGTAWTITTFLSNLKTVRNIILGSTLYMAILYIVPIVLILLHYRIVLSDKRILYMIILGILMFFVSLSGWAAIFYKTDSIQVFFNITIPMLCVMSYFLLLYIYNAVQSKLSKAIIVGAFLFTCTLNGTSLFAEYKITEDYQLFLKEVKHQIDSGQLQTKTGVILYGERDYKEEPNAKYTSLFSNIGDMLFVYDDDFRCIGTSDYEIPVNDNSLLHMGDNEIISMGYYYNYLSKRKSDLTYPYKDQPSENIVHLYDFIKSHKVSFAFVSENYPYINEIKAISKSSYYYKEGKMFFCVLK
jgi:hypothetical protein